VNDAFKSLNPKPSQIIVSSEVRVIPGDECGDAATTKSSLTRSKSNSETPPQIMHVLDAMIFDQINDFRLSNRFTLTNQ
jgi:hypothetical protein